MSIFLFLIILNIFSYHHQLFAFPFMWVTCYSLLIIFLKDYSPFPSRFGESFCMLEILSLCLSYMLPIFFTIHYLSSVIFWDNKDIRIYNQICLFFPLWHLVYIRKSFPPRFNINILLESFILFLLIYFLYFKL